MLVQVEFKDIVFRFEPSKLAEQYKIVSSLTKSGHFTHMDAAYCHRALREGVYAVFGMPCTFFVEVSAERRGSRVTQVMEVESMSKEEACQYAGSLFRDLFPLWEIPQPTIVNYETFRRFKLAEGMHKTLRTSKHAR